MFAKWRSYVVSNAMPLLLFYFEEKGLLVLVLWKHRKIVPEYSFQGMWTRVSISQKHD